jgi:hypothetical protein
MILHMKAILVQLDDYTATLLDKVAPGHGRKRSQFIRQAVIRALMDVTEVSTRRAYERDPDSDEWWFDPRAWAPATEAIRPAAREKKPGERAGRPRTRARTRRS